MRKTGLALIRAAVDHLLGQRHLLGWGILRRVFGGGPDLIDSGESRITQRPEFVFHHPLIRAVTYEAQLKSDRAELHRRLAAAIEARDPQSVDDNAALIAEHLEAAGDLHAAYGWHMRAATWATNRDIAAARLSWECAEKIADAAARTRTERPCALPLDLLCGNAGANPCQ